MLQVLLISYIIVPIIFIFLITLSADFS